MRVGPQGIDRVILACQFGFRERGVDFVMANLMQQHDGPALAPAQSRYQVMPALWNALGDWTITQITNWNVIVHTDQIDQSMIGPFGTIPKGLRSSDGEK